MPLFLIAVIGITDESAFAAGKQAKLSNLVVVGDSLSAGYQNSQLIESSQIHGYANVIATQAGADLNLPLIPYPGFPQTEIQGGFAVNIGFEYVPRRNHRQTRDLAVPGYTVAALVGYPAHCNIDPTNPVPVAIQMMAFEILNPACSSPAPTQLEEAAALFPSTSILWAGSNDALFAILFGGDPTDPVTFAYLHQMAASTMAQVSGTLVLANIPDVTLTPYLTSIERLGTILGLPVPVVRQTLGLHPGDMVTPYAFPLITEMNGSLVNLPEDCPQGPVVLRASKITQIRATVLAYNAAIAKEAADHNAVLVDIYALIKDLAAHGVVVGGRKLTTDFMGGLFSLDGVHPTNTGYAIVANEFIRTMNRTVAAAIPPVSIEQVSKTDPLIFPADHPGKAKGHVGASVADALRAVFR